MTTHSQVKKWYDNWYLRHKNKAMRPLGAYQVFLERLELKKDTHLLDVACGNGFFIQLAHQKGVQVSGIDISEQAIGLAKKNTPSAQLNVQAVEHMSFKDQSFDYITCLGSIEHFLDPAKAFDQIRRVSKKQAKFLFVVPNKHFLFDYFKGSHGTQQQDIKEDLKSLRDWKNLFKDNGFYTLSITPDTWIKESVKKELVSAKGFEKIKLYIKHLIWMFLPLCLTYQFVFVLEKLEVRSES